MDELERTTVRRGVDEPDPRGAGVTSRTERQLVREGPTAGQMARRLVALLFAILQVLIILRIVFLLLVANRDNGVVVAVLGATDPFVEPFRGMFRLDRVGAGQGSVLDVAAAVALVAWTLVEALVIAVLNLGSRRSTEPL